MIKNIEEIRTNFSQELKDCKSLKELELVRVKYLGKNGELTLMLKSIGNMEAELRKEAGLEANRLKIEMTSMLETAKANIEGSAVDDDDFDITLPGTRFGSGSYHPITIVQREVEEVFKGMGFMITDTPEVESEYYNFEALNIPFYHPARDMQDTYWLDNGMVLRTQTSAGQVRMMEKVGPPMRVIIPGRCFRNEEIDPSHENTFFQLEGIVIDEGISVANLIYTMEELLTRIFKRKAVIRLRPGYFPFVEPGFELDIQCSICGGKGCPTCKHSGWVELLPCGMVHPNVLKSGRIDTDKYTGFAFGLGLTRLAMMKYGIPDIRIFNSGNIKILKQFR
jgi:phenylalanyl-tRNA synthetase alpha chain